MKRFFTCDTIDDLERVLDIHAEPFLSWIQDEARHERPLLVPKRAGATPLTALGIKNDLEIIYKDRGKNE